MSDSFKIAIVGAGSVEFTRKLVADILKVPEFADIEIALTDINQRNLDMIAKIIQRIVEVNKLPAKVTATTDRRKAFEGARYVMSCVRVGGLEGFQTDIDIPLKYGVDQCVGDTLCAGGIMYGQRNIPVILDFCKDIREVAEPGARFLNYANPMAMNTWAANKYGGVETIGLCHGVQHGGEQIARIFGVEDDEVDFICSGINHQTWYIDIRVKGRKIEKDELIERFEAHPVYSKQEKVRIDVLKRFGYYSTESNGHLSEYLPWYRKRPEEIGKWIDMSEWIHGETGGYLRFTTENRNWFETDYDGIRQERPTCRSPSTSAPPSTPATSSRPSRPAASIAAISTCRNNGVITNLPDDAIIESPGFVDRFGINMVEGITLPIQCAATCSASISVQRMSRRGRRSRRCRHAQACRCCTTRWSAPSARPKRSGRWPTRCSSPRPNGCRNMPTPSRRRKERLAKGTVKTREWKGAARRSVS